jgi:hypothetical protein
MSLHLKFENPADVKTPASSRANLFVNSADKKLYAKLNTGEVVLLVGGAAVAALTELEDVSVDQDVTDGDALQWDESTGKFLVKKLSYADLADKPTLNALSDSAIADGLDTVAGLVTPKQLKEAAQTHAMVQISDAYGNLVTINNNKLLVPAELAAAAAGVGVWEYLFGDDQATPVWDAGDYIRVGEAGVVFKLRPVTPTESCYFYSLNQDIELQASLSDLTTLVNDVAAYKAAGSIKSPGDCTLHAASIEVEANVIADGDLSGWTLGWNLSPTRKYSQHRVEKLLPGGQGNTATFIMPMKVGDAIGFHSKVTIGKLNDATGYTSLPNDSAVVDMNTLGNVEFPFWIKPVNALGGVHITSVILKLRVTRPEKKRQLVTQTLRDPAVDHPYLQSDFTNQPLADSAVVQPYHWTHNPASTVSATGTLNAQGWANNAVMWVHDNTTVKIGDRPFVGVAYHSNGYGQMAEKYELLTDSYFVTDTRVTDVSSDGHSVTLSAPVKTDFTRQGALTTGNVRCVIFSPSAINFCMAAGALATTDNILYSTITGKKGPTASKNRAVAYSDKAVWVRRVKKSDPLKQWKAGVVTYNLWTPKIGTFSTDNNGDKWEGLTYMLRTPDLSDLPDLEVGPRNKDANVALIMPNGIYGHEATRVKLNATTGIYECSRALFRYYCGKSTPDTIQRSHLANGISDGTRMTSNALRDYLITAADLARVKTTGTVAEIVESCRTAINHRLGMTMAHIQLMTEDYCPNPAVQGTKLNFKSYYGQQARNKPEIVAGSSGWAVGDVLRWLEGDYLEPFSLVVTKVDATTGAILDWEVSLCGMYKTLASVDGSALPLTPLKGTGTGAFAKVINLATYSQQTTLALAFPNTWHRSVVKWPAANRDAAYSTYAGTVPPGALFQFNPFVDLVAMATAVLTASITSPFSPFFWAICFAAQRFGVAVIDLAADTNHIPLFDSTVSDADFAKATIMGSSTFTGSKVLKGNLLHVESIVPSLPNGGIGTLRADLPPEVALPSY